jgi:hypothetical protein
MSSLHPPSPEAQQRRGYNVIPFPNIPQSDAPAAEWSRLTARLVLDQHRRGVLDPRILEYLLAGVGLQQ